MNRRDLIVGAAVVPLAALPAIAGQTDIEQIRHHIGEIRRILAKTLPAGTDKTRDVFLVGDNLICSAFPPNWSTGQPHFTYKIKQGGWVTA